MSDASRSTADRRKRRELLGWSVAASVLVTLAVPWFLWGDATVVAGLPVWVWWHVAWMALASVVFYAFTQRAWGIGIVQDGAPERSTGETSDPVSAEEVNHRG